VALARENIEMEQSGAVVMVAQTVTARNSGAVLMLANNVEGDVRVVVDRHSAAAFGAVCGAVLGGFLLLARLIGRRR